MQPLLLVCEDLHWLDTETQALLESLSESLPTARLLLLVNYRPDYRHGWGSKTYYTQVRLDPLPPAMPIPSSSALVGDDPSLAPLTPLLIQRTEGNPFFLEESVRTLVEAGALVGTPGAYRLMHALPTMQVPATVQAVLAARLDRLPPEEKRLLQTAAVIGTEMPLALLQAVGELSAEALRLSLVHLQDAEFLYEARLFPELVYTFKHALTQEVAYSSLLQERRRVLHAQIVDALEALAGEGLRPAPTQSRQRVAEQVERLAHHALRGRGVGQSCDLLPAGRGQGLRPRRVPRGAGRFRAGSPGPRAPARGRRYPGVGHRHPPRLDTTAGHIGRDWAEPCPVGRGRGPGAGARRPDPVGIGASQDDQGTEDNGEITTAPWRWAGRPTRSQANSATAPCRGKYSLTLAEAYYAIGDFGRAAELLQWSVEAADRASGMPSTRASGMPSTDVGLMSQAWLARTLSALGAFAEGRRHGEEALRLATLEGRGNAAIAAHSCLGHVYLAQGDLEHAIRVLDQGLALCRASRQPAHWLQWIVAGLGSASGLQGRFPEGRALLEEAIREDISAGALENHSRWVAWLSEVCRLAGCSEEAGQHARQALDLARQHKARGDEALALHQLGAVQAHADPPDIAQAEAHYQQALSLANELGMRPLVAHCHLGLGTLYSRVGRLEEARTALATAIHMYRTLEMSLWLPQAEATLAQIGEREY